MIENFAFQSLNKPYDYIDLDYAAVSILVYKNKEILFIKRSENMPTHKGHIAFPGGKKELSDSLYLEFEAPFYKIRYGNFKTKQDAELQKEHLVNNGMKDIWIIRSRIKN